MTAIFIYIMFGIMIAFDIFLVVKYGREKTITAVFRQWYKTMVFIPYAIGVLFLGHFLNLIEIRDDALWIVVGLTSCSLPIIGISVYMKMKDKVLTKKWYPIIFIVIGYFVGDIWF